MPTDKRARQKAAREARLAAERRRARRNTLLRRGGIIAGIAVIVGVSAYFITKGGGSSNASTTSSTTTSTTTASSGANHAAQTAANTAAVAAGCPSSTTAAVNSLSWSSPPAMTIDTSKNYTATVTTTAGTFTVALDAAAAPQLVNNFVFLADKGYYHCNTFFRVIPNFMNQTGDPTGTGGDKQPGYKIDDENLPTSAPTGQAYPAGTVAMANSGANTNGSQFFVVVNGSGLQPDYAIIGHVVTGMSVVDKINAQGNASQSANGEPPDVTQRILTVSISDS